MSRPFEAAYIGTCAACDGKIHDGEWVQFDDADQLVHVVCPDPTAAARGERPPFGCCLLIWRPTPTDLVYDAATVRGGLFG